MGQTFQIGDLVTRESHGGDLVFQVVRVDIERGLAILRGRDKRLMADAPLEDLRPFTGEVTRTDDRGDRLRQKVFHQLILSDHLGRRGDMQTPVAEAQSSYGEIYGTVLHVDGDESYLAQCLAKYDELNIVAYGYYIDEEEQPHRIKELLLKHHPDVLVITGHDGMKRDGSAEINNYYSSRYFVESVKVARGVIPDKDSLVIFAGACQSYYEAIIEAGANFASSPERINIHTFDPVRVAETIVRTSIKEVVSPTIVIDHSITKSEGVGGIESRGKMRRVLPKI